MVNVTITMSWHGKLLADESPQRGQVQRAHLL
jgi:hypothetical protein